MTFPKQNGRVTMVTGANTGLGFEIAKTLYKRGAHVVVAGRNASRINDAIAKLTQEGGTGSLEAGHLDLANLSAVQGFAEDFCSRHPRLDLLVNNAGVMAPPESKTADGFELQFGVNFLGHFALTGHLFGLLQAAQNARVVTMSSIGHRGATIDFDTFRLNRPYAMWREYGQSKLADLMLALELHRRIRAQDGHVASLAAHPGVTETELTRHLGSPPAGISFMDVAQGAKPALVAALSPDAKSGQYWGPTGPEERSGEPGLTAVDPAANDVAVRARLWDWAEQATGVKFPAAA